MANLRKVVKKIRFDVIVVGFIAYCIPKIIWSYFDVIKSIIHIIKNVIRAILYIIVFSFLVIGSTIVLSVDVLTCILDKMDEAEKPMAAANGQNFWHIF